MDGHRAWYLTLQETVARGIDRIIGSIATIFFDRRPQTDQSLLITDYKELTEVSNGTFMSKVILFED
jgi:hypothetical protein